MKVGNVYVPFPPPPPPHPSLGISLIFFLITASPNKYSGCILFRPIQLLLQCSVECCRGLIVIWSADVRISASTGCCSPHKKGGRQVSWQSGSVFSCALQIREAFKIKILQYLRISQKYWGDDVPKLQLQLQLELRIALILFCFQTHPPAQPPTHPLTHQEW